MLCEVGGDLADEVACWCSVARVTPEALVAVEEQAPCFADREVAVSVFQKAEAGVAVAESFQGEHDLGAADDCAGAGDVVQRQLPGGL